MLTVSVDKVHDIFYGSKLALNTQGASVLIRGTTILWENLRIHQKDGSHPVLQKKSPPDTENLVWKPETTGNLSAGFQQELPAGSSVGSKILPSSGRQTARQRCLQRKYLNLVMVKDYNNSSTAAGDYPSMHLTIWTSPDVLLELWF